MSQTIVIEPRHFIELNVDNVPLAEVDFIGEANPDFAAMIANNLRHILTASDGRRYRPVKLIFEEVYPLRLYP